MRHKRGKGKLKKSSNASIKVASLNMRGRRGSNPLIPPNKWEGINQMMKSKKIGILTIQEVHLTDQRKEELETQYKWL